MPPVLSNAWRKWPPAAYHLFLSVPHKIALKKTDRHKDKHLYWQPDVRNTMSRQTTVFAKNTQSLQEVILNFAIFEFFFQHSARKQQTRIEFLQPKPKANSQNSPSEKNTEKPESQEDAINNKNWFKYLFTPIWINYLFILFFLFFMTSIPVKIASGKGAWIVLANLPYNFSPVITIWFLLTLAYINHIITDLESLHDKVRKGVFDTHLERVPQAILQELANIPQEQHINEGIQYIKNSMRWLSSIALLGFLGVLEVLSQGYGSQAMDFYFGDK